MPSESGSAEFKERVLAEFERMAQDMRRMEGKLDQLKDVNSEQISKLRVEVGMLKVRVALIGAGAGVLVSVVMKLIMR